MSSAHTGLPSLLTCLRLRKFLINDLLSTFTLHFEAPRDVREYCVHRCRGSGIGRDDRAGEPAQLLDLARGAKHHGMSLGTHPHREDALDVVQLSQC